MRYTSEVRINLPRERVVALFDDPDNLNQWQPNFKDMEHISGTPGQPGAKTRLSYDENGRKVEMIETIISHNLPDEVTTTYETNGVFNHVANHFYAEGGQTRWVIDSEFKFNGFMRLVGIFMRGAFPRQTQKDMQRFKEFAERTA